MIRADFHTHTCFSTDSETPVREMIEQAAECGLKTLCITDHWDEDYPNGLKKLRGYRFGLNWMRMERHWKSSGMNTGINWISGSEWKSDSSRISEYFTKSS